MTTNKSIETLRSEINEATDNDIKQVLYLGLIQQSNSELEDYLKFAIFLRDFDIPKSLDILDDAEIKFGKSAWIEDNKARAYGILKKFPEAIDAWEKAEELADEKNKKFFADELSRTLDVVNSYISEEISEAKRKKKWDEVIATLNGYRVHQPSNLYLYLELSIAYRNKKDYKHAFDILKLTEKYDLKSPWIHDNYARIYFDIAQYKKSLRECLIALSEARSDNNREQFIGLLEILKETIDTQHKNGKYLNILPVDIEVLSAKIVDDNVNPNDIPLDIYDNISNEQCDAAFQTLKKSSSFSQSSQEVNKLIAYYLPQLRSILEASDEATSEKLSLKKDSDFPNIHSFDKNESHTLNDYNETDRNRLIEIILISGFFDHLFYTQQINLVLSINEAIENFLFIGAEQEISPMPNFSFQDYRAINSDIPELSNAECFVHYVLLGHTEKRYFNRTMLMRDAALICSYPHFDNLRYSFFAKDILLDWNPQEHYLAIGWRKNLLPIRENTFNSDVYLKYYLDARQSEKPPYLHFLMSGANRLSCMIDIEHHLIQPIFSSTEFDISYYNSQCKEHISDIQTAILHYAFNGIEQKLNPNENFNTEYYSRKYPDLKKATQNPFVHYLNHGRKEGRIAHYSPQQYIKAGHAEFNPNKPTIIVVCHEASRTGAPILGLQLIEQLSYRANIVSWLGKGGSLINNFVESSIAVITDPKHHIDRVWTIRELQKRFALQIAILNSAGTSDISASFYEERIPMLALVHEYSDYMSHEVSHILLTANRIVFPAQGVKDSADVVGVKCFGKARSNTVVRHQGHCIPPTSDDGKIFEREDILLRLGISEDDEIPAVILGCGFVQIRKGVEYFIEAAKYCKDILNKPVRFVWVGSGYNPETDYNYSVWLKSQLVHSNLEEDVIFFEETSDLTPFFELADVFFMSSRLDPFPNVALDAVEANLPIVAFEQATGFADFIHKNPTVGVAVSFLDAHAAAEVICDYITGKRVRPDNSDEITQQLSFSAYADFIWDECQTAIAQQKQIEEESQLLTQYGQLHTDFFTSATPNWHSEMTAEYEYVAMWARGIVTAKSRAGFNDMKAQKTMSVGTGEKHTITPLARMIIDKTAPFTHKTIYVNPEKIAEKWKSNLSIALHIHAYYPEGLPSLLKRFSTFEQNIAFYVTTDTDDKVKIITAIAKKLSLKVNVITVPNRGRDVGPFIMAMKEHLSDFEVVGHFHLKGTKQLEQTVVQQWQDFLFNTLIGQHGETANALLQTLEQDPELGLLFQEDPCLPNWSKNRALADKLLKDLEINTETPDIIEYPTGNMFWVRTAALAPLLKRDWQWKDFPAEPIPYDGSILHAVERIIPLICEEAGYEWATVHNPTAKRYS